MNPEDTACPEGSVRLQPEVGDNRFEVLAGIAPVGIAFAVDRKFVWANPAFCQLCGYSPEEIVGLDPLTLITPEYRDASIQRYQSLLRDKISTPLAPVGFIHRSGEMRIMSTLSTFCHYHGQEAVMTVAIDVTERHKAETELKQSHQQLAAMNRIANALGHSLQLSEVLDIALDEALAIVGGAAGSIGLIDRARGIIELVAQRGMSPELAARLKTVPLEESWDLPVIDSGQVLVLDDVTDLPQTFEETRVAGVKSVVAFALSAGDETLGLINVTSPEVAHFRTIPGDFFQAIGAQIGMAIANARLYTEKADSEEHYRTLFETVPDPIVLLSLDEMRFIGWNTPFLEQSGYTEEDLRNMRLADIALPEEYAEARANLELRVREDSRDPGRYEMRCRQKDGQMRQLSLHLAPYMEGERMVALQVVARDVTEERKLQDQLLHTEKLSALGQLVSGVAHELNNPLAAILLAAEMLLQSELDPAQRRKLDMIVAQVQRCSALTQDLRLFARSDPPQRVAVNVGEIIHQACTLTTPAFRRQHARIRLELPEELPRVVGDPNQLEQVFVNLIGNALHAMEDAPEPQVLTLSAYETRQDGSRILRLRFADSGPGVAPNLRPRLFEPFFSTKPPGKGTGLGLPVSLGIIQSHGGSLYLEPSDSGAVFVVDLPVAQEEPAPDADATRRPCAPRDLGGLRVMVLDDEANIVSMLGDLLRASNCQVYGATHVSAALEALSRTEFDVILCDICMPLHQGKIACDALREYLGDARPELLLLMTGDTAGEETLRVLGQETLPTLRKPFSYERMVEAIQKALAGEPWQEEE